MYRYHRQNIFLTDIDQFFFLSFSERTTSVSYLISAFNKYFIISVLKRGGEWMNPDCSWNKDILIVLDKIFISITLILIIFQYATTVKALIAAGTCSAVTTTSTICGNSSLSYSSYETFTYNNYRVVVISGVPNHAAEYNQTSANPNTRCESYDHWIL